MYGLHIEGCTWNDFQVIVWKITERPKVFIEIWVRVVHNNFPEIIRTFKYIAGFMQWKKHSRYLPEKYFLHILWTATPFTAQPHTWNAYTQITYLCSDEYCSKSVQWMSIKASETLSSTKFNRDLYCLNNVFQRRHSYAEADYLDAFYLLFNFWYSSFKTLYIKFEMLF